MATLPHILLAIVGATLAGAVWAGIAGFLKATVGAHEVISTIMLNWIAIWVGDVARSATAARSRTPTNKTLPISNDIASSAKLPVFWGDKELQGLHVGFFVALAALVVFWLLLNRTTLGYEVRAVGFNPEAAALRRDQRARRTCIRAMAISGAFAGLAGGARHARLPLPLRRRPTSRSRRSASSGSRSRCSAGTPRSASASARCSSARCSSGRRTASQSSVIDPELAGNLTYIIQGLDRALRRRRRAHPLRLERAPEAAAPTAAAAEAAA